MQTNFSKKQLEDKDNLATEKIFKQCVHCGMCNATCPTHQLLGCLLYTSPSPRD